MSHQDAKTALNLDNDQAVQALMQIQGIMDQDEALKGSMAANTESDFQFAYLDKADDALVEGLDTNQKLFTLLLNDEALKRRTFGILANDMYRRYQRKVKLGSFASDTDVQTAMAADETVVFNLSQVKGIAS